WMATFADMATLLMAFFVLILSFAEMNVPKYKQITGSLKAAFGVQRLVPVVEPPKAQSLIAREFSPAIAKPTPQQVVKQE
ncbi:MAG TPA: flagellar motor protein, partial [Gammaproteobacteria bacterium]|nr:flagellar motor protein [Gammaproteobacteria bacterium]